MAYKVSLRDELLIKGWKQIRDKLLKCSAKVVYKNKKHIKLIFPD